RAEPRREPSWSHRPGHSESKRVELNLAVAFEPGGRAEEFGLVVPGSSSNDPVGCVTALEPRGAVGRRACVTVVPNIFDPLPDIAFHVGETKGIRSKRSNRGGLQHRSAAASIAVGVADARLISPRVTRARAGARRILPFGLRQEPIVLACQPR